MELEEQLLQQSEAPAFSIPTTLGEALRLAADQQDIIELQKYQIETSAKKVHHYDLIVDRTDLVIATQVGNKLGLTPYALNTKLEKLGVYNLTVKRGRTFQKWFIEAGYGIAKQANKGYSQCLFTLTGEAWIIEKLTFNQPLSQEQQYIKKVRAEVTSTVINNIDDLLLTNNIANFITTR